MLMELVADNLLPANPEDEDNKENDENAENIGKAEATTNACNSRKKSLE